MFDSYITGAGLSNPLSYVMPLSGGYVMKADGSLSAFLSSDQMHPGYAVSSTSGKISATDLLTNDAVTVSLSQVDVSNQPVSSALIVPPTNAIRLAMGGVLRPARQPSTPPSSTPTTRPLSRPVVGGRSG